MNRWFQHRGTPRLGWQHVVSVVATPLRPVAAPHAGSWHGDGCLFQLVGRAIAASHSAVPTRRSQGQLSAAVAKVVFPFVKGERGGGGGRSHSRIEEEENMVAAMAGRHRLSPVV